MTEKTIDLDQHRGMAAQKATELRRLLANVEADQKALRLRHDELESQLLAAPAANWHEAAEKPATFSISLQRHSLRKTRGECRRHCPLRAACKPKLATVSITTTGVHSQQERGQDGEGPNTE